MTTGGEPTKEFIYLGAVEVTGESIALDPEPENATLRALILSDLIREAGWHDPWQNASPAPTHELDPAKLLDLLADGVFETTLDEADDERTHTLALEALAEGPYNGAIYAVGIALLPPLDVRFSAVEPLAYRNGDTWRDPVGLRLTEDKRATATRVALEDIRSRNPWGL